MSASELIIRPMLPSDVVAVALAERVSYAFPWSEGIFRDCLRSGYHACVAEFAHMVVGYGVLSVAADEAHLLNVCVSAEYRCRGFGLRLLNSLFDHGRARGAKQLFLEVRPSNIAAIRLYQTIGLIQVGIRRGYYQAVGGREDAIVMQLRLAD